MYFVGNSLGATVLFAFLAEIHSCDDKVNQMGQMFLPSFFAEPGDFRECCLFLQVSHYASVTPLPRYEEHVTTLLKLVFGLIFGPIKGLHLRSRTMPMSEGLRRGSNPVHNSFQKQ